MPTTSAASAREILTGLHDVMASKAGAQAKLNKVVKIIAEALASEVCSIYLLRDGVLELFATVGLKQSAVHVTKLAMGEGLVGTIADRVAILNLDEATRHPEFAYKPETGEELYHSFAGVPIVRRERAIGVLAVQHADPRAYDDVEIEALQTVAMVLSELIANAGLADKASVAARERDASSIRLAGFRLVTGMAKGQAVYHQPRVLIEHTVAEDVEAERHRVYSAFRKMREQIDSMTSGAEFGTAGEHQEILETYKMFAYDEGWSRRINEAIDSGLTAEAAIERVQQRTRMRMREIDDPLLQERMHDLDDLANRLQRIVSGQLGTAAQMGLRGESILIAKNLGPAELLEYDKRRLKGVVLEEGSLTAHVVIVARATITTCAVSEPSSSTTPLRRRLSYSSSSAGPRFLAMRIESPCRPMLAAVPSWPETVRSRRFERSSRSCIRSCSSGSWISRMRIRVRCWTRSIAASAVRPESIASLIRRPQPSS